VSELFEFEKKLQKKEITIQVTINLKEQPVIKRILIWMAKNEFEKKNE